MSESSPPMLNTTGSTAVLMMTSSQRTERTFRLSCKVLCHRILPGPTSTLLKPKLFLYSIIQSLNPASSILCDIGWHCLLRAYSATLSLHVGFPIHHRRFSESMFTFHAAFSNPPSSPHAMSLRSWRLLGCRRKLSPGDSRSSLTSDVFPCDDLIGAFDPQWYGQPCWCFLLAMVPAAWYSSPDWVAWILTSEKWKKYWGLIYMIWDSWIIG